MFNVSGNNKKGFIETGVSHKAKISPKTLPAGTTKVKWSISAVAISNNGTVLGKINTTTGEYDVAKGPSRDNIMELQFGAQTWKKPEVLALFKKTDSVKYTFVATPDKGETMIGTKYATYRPKPLTLECGSRSTQKVNDTIKCTVVASSRLPAKLTGVKVTLEMTGQGIAQEDEELAKAVKGQDLPAAASAAFLEEETMMTSRQIKNIKNQASIQPDQLGKGAVRISGLQAKASRAGPAILIATLTSNELPPNKGYYYLTITE